MYCGRLNVLFTNVTEDVEYLRVRIIPTRGDCDRCHKSKGSRNTEKMTRISYHKDLPINHTEPPT